MASYEVGGRADKFGNRYESRWVVKQMLEVINEKVHSIILEAIGDDEEGVDVLIINRDGSKEYHQCKGRNSSKEKWTIADLKRKDILHNSKKHLDRNPHTKFALISPIPCMMLHALHERALNSNKCSEDFYEYQIKKSSGELSKYFEDYCKFMNLNTSESKDIDKAIDYLSRTDAYIVADDYNEKKNILDKIELYLIGNSEVIYSLLANFAIENNLLGQKITNDMIIKYLQSNGVELRNLAYDTRIMPRINELNLEFLDSVNLINKNFINRKEVDDILYEIENGNSVVIHGKAGYGKSGCVYDVLKKLKSSRTGYLALKMDRRMPKESAKKYGDSLDLRVSPIHCIHELYKHERAVVIFDQLDAIRWTNVHSSTSIDVCKEMIRQVHQLNKERKYNISIIFVCRTYDYEHDKSIKSLFEQSDESDTNQTMRWKEIKIHELEDSDVRNIIGDSYNKFSKRMKEILRVPNNLYIWSLLDEDRKLNEINSSNELIKEWMDQLIINYENKGRSNKDIYDTIDGIIKLIEGSGRLEVHKRRIHKYSTSAINYLKSEGLINENREKISFVHQSFFDYFLVEKMLDQVLETTSIVEIIGDKRKQTPMKRYQIQMLLQIVQEIDFDLFISLGYQMLENANIRFFMKYVYLEVLSQSISISKQLEALLKKYICDEKYKQDFIDIVFMNHEVFILYLIENKIINSWLDGSIDEIKLAASVLKSVNTKIQDEIVKVISPYILKCSEIDIVLYNCLCDDIIYDSDDMFSIRINLIQANPRLLERYFFFNELFNKNPKRALLILKEIIIYSSNQNRKDIYRGIDEIFYELDKIEAVDGKMICEILLPLVPEENRYYSEKLDGWIVHYNEIQNPARACIYLLKEAMKDIIEKDVYAFLEILKIYENSQAMLINEILLESSIKLDEKYADYIISWISANNGIHFLNRSGQKKDELYYTKKIISKFSPYCSNNEFIKLENLIYNYHERNEIEILKDRIETNTQGNELYVYWHYWGEIQYSLLPHLCYNRLSIKSKNLIPVLERRFKNTYLRHQKSKSHGGFVSSTISQNAHLFSDKTWIDIIINKKVEDRKGSRWIETEGGFFESTVEQFARTFGMVGENDPTRFINLAINLPNNIDNSYIYQIFKLIGLKESTNMEKFEWRPCPVEIAEKVISKYQDALYDVDCAKSLCISIKNRSNENWSIKTLEKISKLAVLHPHPRENEIVVGDENDKDMQTFDTLWTNSYNCVRGTAAETIGSILWERKELIDLFRETIEILVEDKHPAVRLSAINCLCPIYNIDRNMSERLTIKLLNSDFRIAAHYSSRQLVYLMYKRHKEELNNIIEKMFFSEDKDVSKAGAVFATNIYIRYDKLENLIFTEDRLNDNQKYGIILSAINLFNKEEYKDKCNKILNLFLDEDNENGDLYNRLFWDKKIDIIKDKDLVLKILNRKVSRKVINYFVEYLENYDDGILEFSEIIFELCKSIIENIKDISNISDYNLYGIEGGISNLLMSLYDKSIDIDHINEKCLDMLDMMFENSIGNLRVKLNNAIMDY